MCKFRDNTRLQQFSQYFKQKYDLDITFKSDDYKHFQYTIKNTIFIDDSQEYWIQKIKNDLKMLVKQEDCQLLYIGQYEDEFGLQTYNDKLELEITFNDIRRN